MMYLKKISIHKLRELISIAYKDDTDLFSKFHIKNMDYEAAVESTYKMIKDASTVKKLSNYAVIYDKQPIGYITTFDGDFLYSYALAVKYRVNEIVDEWWMLVRSVLDADFRTMIYSNNIRAIKFLKKKLALVNVIDGVDEDEGKTVLIFKNLV